MKEFDWENAKTEISPTRLNWMWCNHNAKISEQQFIKEMQSIRKFSSHGKKGAWRKRSKFYCPSNLKREYKYLKTTFGFFK